MRTEADARLLARFRKQTQLRQAHLHAGDGDPRRAPALRANGA